MTERKGWSVVQDGTFITSRWERELDLQAKRLPLVEPRGYSEMMKFMGQQTLLDSITQRSESEMLMITFKDRALCFNGEKAFKPSAPSKNLVVMFCFPDQWEFSQDTFADVCKMVDVMCKTTLRTMRSLTLKGFGAETWLQIVMNSDIAIRRLDLSPCFPNTYLMVRWLTLHFPAMECVHLNLFPCHDEIFQHPELQLVSAGKRLQVMDIESASKLERSIGQLAFHFADFSGVSHKIRFLELHFASALLPKAHITFFSAPSLEQLGVRRAAQVHTRERGHGWDYAALTHPILQHMEQDNHIGAAESTYSVFWSRTHRYDKGCDLFVRGQEPYQEPPCLLSDKTREIVYNEEIQRRGKDYWNWEMPLKTKDGDRQNVRV
jgi:hypothetical protein